MDRDHLFRRVWALSLLVPIAFGWAWFVRLTPILRWHQQANLQGDSIELGSYRFSLSNKTATRFSLDETAASLPANANGFSFRIALKQTQQATILKAPKQTETLRNTVYSHREQRLVHDFEVSVERDSWPCFVSERFFVIGSKQGIRWLDLENGRNDWQSYTWPTRKVSIGIMAHSDQPVFRSTYIDSNSTNPTPQVTTELFRFNDEGQVEMLATWSHLAPQYYNAKFKDDRILTVDSTGSNLESRSIEDGRLVETIPLETPVASFGFSPTQDFLQENGKPNIMYTLSGRQLISPLSGLNTFLELSPDAKICLWYDLSFARAVVTDAETDRVRCEIREPNGRFDFLDSQTLISRADDWGLTLRTHDLTTGETLTRWRPFWWIWPCLAVLSITTLAWTWFWTRMPKPSATWGWIDFTVLMSLWMVGLVARVMSVGDPLDASRLSFFYAQSVCASGLFIAWYNLLIWNQRWIIRAMQLLATYSIVLASIAAVLGRKPLEACQGLISVSLPSLVAMPIWICMAVYQWRAMKYSIQGDEGAERRHRIQMRDLFWLTGIIAILMLAIKPLLPGMGAWSQVPLMLVRLGWLLALIAGSTWLGIFTACTPIKFWRRVGLVSFFLSLCFLTADVMMICLYGEHWQFRPAIIAFRPILYHVQCSGCSLATSFLLARCLVNDECHPSVAQKPKQ